jgi:hypothetical protein
VKFSKQKLEIISLLAEAPHKVRTSLDITLKVTGQRTIWLGKGNNKRK